MCLAREEALVDEEENHKNAGNAAQRGHLQGRCAGGEGPRLWSPSAFMRAAVEKELRGADATLDESEQRITASLERYSKQVRRVSTGQQALFAYVDALAKVILSTLPDTDEDTRKAAVARGKTPLLPVPEECWSQHGGRRPGGALGTGEPCPGRMTTTIRSFGSGRGSLPSRESGAHLQGCPLPSGRF